MVDHVPQYTLLVLALCVRPVKTEETEETASHRQNSNVKEVGTPRPPQMRSNFCTSLIALSTAGRYRVTQTACEKQLSRNNSAARQSTDPAVRAQVHLPALDLSWALGKTAAYHLPGNGYIYRYIYREREREPIRSAFPCRPLFVDIICPLLLGLCAMVPVLSVPDPLP